MADNDIDKQKLAYFQEITGVKDEALSHQVLDAYGWDLDSAIQALVDKNTNAIPEYEESMRDSAVTQQPGAGTQVSGAAVAAESRDTGRRVPRMSASLAGVSAPVVAAARAEASIVDDDRSLFERIGDGPESSTSSASASSSTSVVSGATLVWRVVALPFVILRGSYNLLYGAVGLSYWIAGGVLSSGLGTCS